MTKKRTLLLGFMAYLLGTSICFGQGDHPFIEKILSSSHNEQNRIEKLLLKIVSNESRSRQVQWTKAGKVVTITWDNYLKLRPKLGPLIDPQGEITPGHVIALRKASGVEFSNVEVLGQFSFNALAKNQSDDEKRYQLWLDKIFALNVAKDLEVIRFPHSNELTCRAPISSISAPNFSLESQKNSFQWESPGDEIIDFSVGRKSIYVTAKSTEDGPKEVYGIQVKGKKNDRRYRVGTGELKVQDLKFHGLVSFMRNEKKKEALLTVYNDPEGPNTTTVSSRLFTSKKVKLKGQSIGEVFVCDLNNDGYSEFVSVTKDPTNISFTNGTLTRVNVFEWNGKPFFRRGENEKAAVLSVATRIKKKNISNIFCPRSKKKGESSNLYFITWDSTGFDLNILGGKRPKVAKGKISIGKKIDLNKVESVQVVDIENDGDPEIVISEMGKVHVLDIDGQPKLGWGEVSAETASNKTSYNPVVFDEDGDGKNELYVMKDTTLKAFDSDGTQLSVEMLEGPPLKLMVDQKSEFKKMAIHLQDSTSLATFSDGKKIVSKSFRLVDAAVEDFNGRPFVWGYAYEETPRGILPVSKHIYLLEESRADGNKLIRKSEITGKSNPYNGRFIIGVNFRVDYNKQYFLSDAGEIEIGKKTDAQYFPIKIIDPKSGEANSAYELVFSKKLVYILLENESAQRLNRGYFYSPSRDLILDESKKEEGEYRIYEVEGPLIVDVMHVGYADERIEINPDDVGKYVKVVLNGNKSENIKGRVVVPVGEKFKGVMVALHKIIHSSFGGKIVKEVEKVKVDEKGYYEFKSVGPGDHYIFAKNIHDNNLGVDGFRFSIADEIKRSRPSEKLPTREVDDLKIGNGVYSISVKVVDQSGRPLKNVSVELKNPMYNELGATGPKGPKYWFGLQSSADTDELGQATLYDKDLSGLFDLKLKASYYYKEAIWDIPVEWSKEKTEVEVVIDTSKLKK